MLKDGFPVVVEPTVRTSQSKKHVILTSWASVATALLLVLLVGGAFYVADLKARTCTETGSNQEHITRHFSIDYDRGIHEERHLDQDDRTQLIIRKGEDGNIVAITAIDFNRMISAMYVPGTDQCLLLAGEDIPWMFGADHVDDEAVKLDELRHLKQSDDAVTDMSILPDLMKPYCQGTPTFWLLHSENTMRQKRGDCCPSNMCAAGRCPAYVPCC